jgi:hypothetical protein
MGAALTAARRWRLEGRAPAHTHPRADGGRYSLHGKSVVLPGCRQQVCWLAGRATPGAALAAPPGYRVAESPAAGRPLRRKG